MGKVLISKEQLLAEAEKLSLSGSFDWDYLQDSAQYSPGMYRIFGLEPDSNPKPSIVFELMHPDDLLQFKSGFDAIVQGDLTDIPQLEFRIVRTDGTLRHLWSKISPEYSDEGQLTRLLGVVRDITEPKKQETLTSIIYNISRSASEYNTPFDLFSRIHIEIRRLIDASNMFVAYYNEDRDMLDIQYLTGEDEIDEVPAAGTMSKKVMIDNASMLVDTQAMIDMENRGEIVRVGKESQCWLGVPLRRNGNPFGVMVIQNYEIPDAFGADDLSLMEFICLQVESAIRKMEDSEQINKLTNSVLHSPVTVVITNRTGLIEYVNPKFEEVTGYSSQDAIGQNPRILKSGETPVEVYEKLWDTILSGKEWRGEFKNKRKDGSYYWESASISSVKNVAGEITHFIAVKEDISERKLMDAALIEAKDKAEEANRLKTSFLANLSHEIRTPMNGILGFAELLREDGLRSKDFEHYLDIINVNGQQLLNIINDIITVANLEVNQLRLNVKEFELNQVLTDLESTMEWEKKQLLKNHIHLDLVGLKPPTSTPMCTDPGKLVQILTNLLRNAIKFTDQGEVLLSNRMINDGFIEFTVSDTGIGIPEHMHDVIFERFRQADESSTRNFGGNGLGLAISKGLVELLGGTIKVKSNPGQGAIFTFSIPTHLS